MICKSAYDRKAEEIVIMEMQKRTSLCDFFILMSAPSSVRAKAIVDHIEDTMENEGLRAKHKEGYQEALWILLDYGDVIVHIFYHESRQFYDLEHLWGDAPKRHFLK